jgi:hypothetical protein
LTIKSPRNPKGGGQSIVTNSGYRLEAASISSASARSIDMRAWQKTCFPASSAEIVTAECMYGVVPIQTMSMSGVATNSAQSRIGSAPANSRGRSASELSYVEFETATNFHVGVFFEGLANAVCAQCAGPTIPIRNL